MSEKVGIVWNPSKVEEGKLRSALAEALAVTFLAEDDQPECAWFETSVDDPGQGATREALAEGCTLVIAVGGDGTVRSVAEALGRAGDDGGSPADLGIVPLGTGNLLARNLGVPLGNAQAAFERALTGSGSPLDLGEVRFAPAPEEQDDDAAPRWSEPEGFVVMVGFGIDAQMIVETDDELKAKAGWLAYVESLGRAAAGTEVVEVELRLDDAEEPRTARAHTMLVGNCGSIQGGMTLLPDAAPDDGELDLLLLSAEDAGSWLDTMKNMVWDNGLMRLVRGSGETQSSESTEHLRARKVLVELPTPLHFEIDGDDVGRVSAFEASVRPSALQVR